MPSRPVVHGGGDRNQGPGGPQYPDGADDETFVPSKTSDQRMPGIADPFLRGDEPRNSDRRNADEKAENEKSAGPRPTRHEEPTYA